MPWRLCWSKPPTGRLFPDDPPRTRIHRPAHPDRAHEDPCGPSGGGVVYRITLPPPLSDWKSFNLGDANAPDLGDFDGDGLANLLEYALIADPATPDPTAVPLAEPTTFPDDTRLAITVPRDPARTDITTIVEVSETLLPFSWSTLASSTAGGVFTGTRMPCHEVVS